MKLIFLLLGVFSWYGVAYQSRFRPIFAKQRLKISGNPENLVDLNTVNLNTLPSSTPSSTTTTTMQSFVQDEIKTIISILLKVDSLDSKQGLTNHASPLLLENTHVLCKGREYENVMSRLIRESSSFERSEQLERVHALVSGFVQAERKNRARQKVTLIVIILAINFYPSF
ncbi:hypothetical protein EON65_57665 [archaeon]|nr:MAG: hypothetical protein EON65_57665 [archaeon]